MKKSLQLSLLLIAFTLLLPSCVSKKKWEELVSQKSTLESSLTDTQTQVANLEDDLKVLKEEKVQLEDDYAIDKKQLTAKIGQIESDLGMIKKEKLALKEELAASETKINELGETLKAPFSPFAAKGFSLAPEGSMLYLKGMQAIQYKSGSTRVSKESKEMLKSLADIMIANPGLHLLVEGHTDNVPMKSGARYASNEELSLARAKSVIKFLVKHGAAKKQLTAAGLGDAQPKMAYEAEGNLDEAKVMNRRAEIVVMTSPSNFYNLSQTL